MLFSSDAVAKVINAQFEPVWVSVREVPMITIDFGNGSKIVRTLNGNVATYALAADGTVLDILPGIYQPEAYVEQLDQMAKLHRFVSSRYDPQLIPVNDRLKWFHNEQAELLSKGQEPGKIVVDLTAPVSKAFIENPLKFAIGDAAKRTTSVSTIVPNKSDSKAAETLRSWQELNDDTKINETVHRKAIHKHLAKTGLVIPNDVTKWLYKNVLHADLDDPTLGLGEVLNKNYPFAEEDRDGVKP